MKRAGLALMALLACDVDPTAAMSRAASADGTGADAPSAVVVVSSAAPTSSPPASSSSATVRCTAPSLTHAGPLDARDQAALARCQRPSTGPAVAARRCGSSHVSPPIDHERLERSVVAMSAATRAHVRVIATKGVTMKRQPNAFGLVGDSMTASGAFLRHAPRHVDEALMRSLRFGQDGGQDIIAFYADAEVMRMRGRWRSSFGALRAAQVGARTSWALAGGEVSPLMNMLRKLSPAVAVVLFGGNDAAATSYTPLDELVANFGRDLEAIVDALEAKGVIPVLNTLARHGSTPGVDDCGAARALTNWRIAVQTNALSAKVVEIACRRHLPLIDVRYALDGAVNRGLAADQIHPSTYRQGAEILDSRGMRCGYNVRNYVTLLMLKRIVKLVFVDDGAGDRRANR